MPLYKAAFMFIEHYFLGILACAICVLKLLQALNLVALIIY